MSQANASELQLIDVMHCDLVTARRALQQSNGDVDQAINVLLSGGIPPETQIVPYSPAGPPREPSASSPNSLQAQRQAPQQTIEEKADEAVSWSDRADPSLRRSERGLNKKRMSPIDLTGDDEDEDLRKAMQASLESESSRQKRHQEYGIGTGSGGVSGNEGRGTMSGKGEDIDDRSAWPKVTFDRCSQTARRSGVRRRYGERCWDRRQRVHRRRSCRISIEASPLSKEKGRRKSHERIDLVSEEDEALTRAIEASMLHSHQPTRDQSPLLSASHLDALGANRMRPSERPVAILAPSPFFRVFALALQALYASEPFRFALYDVRFTDVRTRHADAHSMEGYWRGASPAGIAKPTQEQWSVAEWAKGGEQSSLDILIRLSTLFSFMTWSKRPIVVAEDVITHAATKNYAYVMNSERRPTHDILACYLQGTLDNLSEITLALERNVPGTCNVDEFKRAFQSIFLPVVASSTKQAEEERQSELEPYEGVVSNLTQTNVNNTVHRALYSQLAEDKALYSQAADTLFFCLGRRSAYDPNFGVSGWDTDFNAFKEAVGSNSTPPSSSSSPSFTLESRIHLDAYMHHRRNGVRLGLDTDEVKGRQRRIEELERYKKSICTHQGEDTRAMLRSSIDYFQHKCKDTANDPVRTSAIQEAGPRLEAILAHLEQEIEATTAEIEGETKAMEDAQSSTLASFEELLARKEYQTMPYDLQCVLMEQGEKAWAYVRHRDEYAVVEREADARWWRIYEGEATLVEEREVLGDRGAINLMVYCASAKVEETSSEQSAVAAGDTIMDETAPTGRRPAKTMKSDLTRDWWAKQSLVESIEFDNATYSSTEGELTSALPEDNMKPASAQESMTAIGAEPQSVTMKSAIE